MNQLSKYEMARYTDIFKHSWANETPIQKHSIIHFFYLETLSDLQKCDYLHGLLLLNIQFY